MTKLSIIIPCYNCKKTLSEAVDSCYVQGLADNDFEIIMVDDCSSDETRQVMKSQAQKHSNITLVFHEINKGGGAARNTAVENSLSEVIFCLDSDDILPNNTLIKMYDYLKKKKCDGVGFHKSINFNGTDINDISHIVTMSYVEQRVPFESLFQKAGVMCSIYQVFMFTKIAFYLAGKYPTAHSFDTQGFAWRFLAAGLHAEICPDTTYLLRVNFHESYYLREYQKGKTNLNWEYILLENIRFFNIKTQTFIRNFDYQDFTKNIIDELAKKNDILTSNFRELQTPTHVGELKLRRKKPISRNSIKGVYLRIKNKLK